MAQFKNKFHRSKLYLFATKRRRGEAELEATVTMGIGVEGKEGGEKDERVRGVRMEEEEGFERVGEERRKKVLGSGRREGKGGRRHWGSGRKGGRRH